MDFIDLVRKSLSAPLPGIEAHQKIRAYKRPDVTQARLAVPPAKESAVLLLLFPVEGQWNTVLIKRPEYQGVHSSQVSFPGGKKEDCDESLVNTALREAYEEIGIEPAAVTMLGSLTELFIPPSNFIVRPFIGYLDHLPTFRIDPSEVVRTMMVPVMDLMLPDILKTKPIFISYFQKEVPLPYFDLDGETVWGATAMILMEFREALRLVL